MICFMTAALRARRRLVASFAFVLAFSSSGWALVISEIHYHPSAGEESLEFIEIANETSSVVEISGYAFVDGIHYTFPPGTLLLGGEALAICADVDAVKTAYGIEHAVGNYEGRLDGGGERVTLANHVGVPVASVRYQDDGKWPVAPDGTGHSLALRSLLRDFTEPENWAPSLELGGSPGEPNFPGVVAPQVEERELIGAGEDWRFMKGTAPYSAPLTAWTEVGFDDSAWPTGPSGFGFGDDDDVTVLEDMSGNYTTIAIRKTVDLDAADLDLNSGFALSVSYDDGFCVFVNGREVVRVNCPEEAGHDAVARRAHEARGEDRVGISRHYFQEGRNVVALLGVNRTLGDNDFTLSPRLLQVRAPGGEPSAFPGAFNELYRGLEEGTGWLEIYNRGTQVLDLSGLELSDHPDRQEPYVFPPGTMIPARGFLVVEEAAAKLALSTPQVRLFLSAPSGIVLAAASFQREPSPDATLGAYSEALYPDGGRPGWVTPTPTRGGSNRVARRANIVINEIYYNPPEERPGEFLELYHRGLDQRRAGPDGAGDVEPVDLSGFRFTKGISYTIPPGVVLRAGEYLVIAEDPEILRQHYGYASALGPYEGSLSSEGENVRFVDRIGNLVDEVRYYEGGSWSQWADGLGASLELIDPRQDNDFAAAWEASDESEKSSWEEFSLDAPAYVPGAQSEIHVLLLRRGICHVDDIRLVREGETQNLIPNPGFEKETRPWLIEGTHVHSERITSDSQSGEACLELVATGKGDSRCNRMETDTIAPLTEGSYGLSLWSRWLRGGSTLIVHGDFAEGPRGSLSTNSLASRFALTVPWNLGTPGEENTARRRLRESTGGDNQGPVIADVRHLPPASDALPVKVHARVADADGVSTVRLLFREDDVEGIPFTAVELFDDGAHDDGWAGDEVYGGDLQASFTKGTKVLFYVEAEDGSGAVTRFPAEAPERSCIFLAGPPADVRLQLILDEARLLELRRRRLHSNDLLDATVVLDNREVYNNVSMRYRGSPWGRAGREGFRVRFGEDRLFLGRQRDINLTNRDREDGMGYYFMSRNATPEVPIPAAEYSYLSADVIGRRFGTMGLFEPYGRGFIKKWLGAEVADEGVLLKADGRMLFDDSCALDTVDLATLIHMGEPSENYRFYWFHKINQGRDNWTPFSKLTRIMDPAMTSDAIFKEQVDSVIHEESFLRVLGTRILMNDTDSLFVTTGHNGYLLWDPRDERWTQLPFDMGASFGSPPEGDLLRIAEARVVRYLSIPRVRRRYYQLLHEFTQGYWSVERAGPFLDALRLSSGVGSARNHVSATALRVAAIVAKLEVEFRIVTNEGQDMATTLSEVEIEGEAPLGVTSLFLQKDDEPVRQLAVEWATTTAWRASIALKGGVNRFVFLGTDAQGDSVARVELTVTKGAGDVFVRGDTDGDFAVNVADPLRTLGFLFHQGTLICPDAADVNDNGVLDLTDVLRTLEYIFRRGDPPASPFPQPGADPTDDSLGCRGG